MRYEKVFCGRPMASASFRSERFGFSLQSSRTLSASGSSSCRRAVSGSRRSRSTVISSGSGFRPAHNRRAFPRRQAAVHQGRSRCACGIRSRHSCRRTATTCRAGRSNAPSTARACADSCATCRIPGTGPPAPHIRCGWTCRRCVYFGCDWFSCAIPPFASPEPEAPRRKGAWPAIQNGKFVLKGQLLS